MIVRNALRQRRSDVRVRDGFLQKCGARREKVPAITYAFEGMRSIQIDEESGGKLVFLTERNRTDCGVPVRAKNSTG